ncbi:MAG TPA: response regulator [Campylobacterales bacterium]|nr:response regulator [Campylobacterales bacterium]
MHKLLERQIKKFFGKNAVFEPDFAAFLQEVNNSYISAQKERALLENALNTSSKELITANQKLKESSDETIKLQRSALDAAANMIMITDITGTIKYANKSFCDFIMYDAAEIIGETPSFLNSGMHSKKFFESMWEQIKNGETFEGEMINKKKNGDIYLEETVITPIRDIKSGAVTHFVAVKKDITERRAQEDELKRARDKALEASRLKSEFLSTMSHEIRTPMNGVIGMTNILLETPLDDEQLDYVNIIKESSNTLLVIINDILDFSKIEAGKLEIESVDIDLIDIVEGAAELLTASAKEKNISLMVYVDTKINTQIKGDPIRIKQILTNLIGNAIKFTDKGEVSVKASPIFGGSVIEKIRFEVTDTGIGISRDMATRLFQSFTQADGSTTRKYGGTGLGLAISKSLCELMGGSIGVESALAKGSMFWFELPFVVGSKAQTNPEDYKTQIASLKDKKAIVVDDSKTAREIVKKYLLGWGLVVDCAFGASEAMEKLLEAANSDAPYHIAVVDLAMPQIDGFELAKEIFATKELENTKCILFTAFDQKGIGSEALEVGYSAYLTKPIKQAALLKSIIDSLQDKKQTRADEPRAYEEQLGVAHDGDEIDASKATKLLLVEDNMVNQRVASLILQKMGCSVKIAKNGAEALQAVEEGDFDIILMDCQMPVMDGFETTARIRARKDAKNSIPIIALTANAIEGDKERCLSVGMDDYISKPINPKDILEKVLLWSFKKSDFIASTEEVDLAVEDPIDMQRLRSIFDDDIDAIKNVLEASIDSIGRNITKLLFAAETKEIKEMKRIAHDVKGESLSMGLREVATLIANAEPTLDTVSFNELRYALLEIKRSLLRAEDFLDTLF